MKRERENKNVICRNENTGVELCDVTRLDRIRNERKRESLGVKPGKLERID